jgi:exonuclease SbcC
VKNYRNYSDEHFDFKDVSFCTINGKNGAGKSSLFMDAILDCLFEEPREGDLTGWIRADQSARSGAIIFAFSIGDHTFRVTRTRTKSGKATLNISEYVNGEWKDRSAEKIKDTQAAIINVLGMDSLTFRSCALIMQDQYGLFLEASKEDRMTILGNILGLGIYDGMESLARDHVAEASRQIARRQAVITNLAQETSGADVVQVEYESTSQEATAAKSALDKVVLQKENISLKLAGRREAFNRAAKLTANINTYEKKDAELTRILNEQRGVIALADDILKDESTIRTNASKSVALAEKEKELLQRRTVAVTRLETLNATSVQVTSLKADIGQAEKNKLSAEQRVATINQQISTAQKHEGASAELQTVVAGVAAMESKEREYRDISEQLSKTQTSFTQAETEYKVEAAERKRTIETYQAKAKMLQDSQCVDVANASCRFLADAKAAQKQLETYLPECTKWKTEQRQRLTQIKGEIEAGKSKLQGTGYNPDALMALRGRADVLRPQAAEYAKIGLYTDMLSRETENKTHIEQNLRDSNVRLESLKNEISGLENLKANIATMDSELNTLQVQINQAGEWVEKEQQLPVATERKATAQRRVEEINTEVANVFSRLSALRAEYGTAMKDAAGKDELETQLKDAAAMVSAKQDQISAIHARLGSLSERLEQIKRKQAEIRSMQDEVNAFSHQAAVYSTLKQAFSQDGIPHNIIRSMLPLLTTTANTILGQMTGGKMGMEFITDKVLKSNSRKEVPTLDIVINEYGKDSLPYLSKSGGEKVKASLSAILSLAEIKSSQAGIQLGMLFIDEPPFLDADGIQAYCDALETIQSRYSGLKVMAITHDPEMKSRFPQSLDIVKDDTGSHVVME